MIRGPGAVVKSGPDPDRCIYVQGHCERGRDHLQFQKSPRSHPAIRPLPVLVQGLAPLLQGQAFVPRSWYRGPVPEGPLGQVRKVSKAALGHGPGQAHEPTLWVKVHVPPDPARDRGLLVFETVAFVRDDQIWGQVLEVARVVCPPEDLVTDHVRVPCSPPFSGQPLEIPLGLVDQLGRDQQQRSFGSEHCPGQVRNQGLARADGDRGQKAATDQELGQGPGLDGPQLGRGPRPAQGVGQALCAGRGRRPPRQGRDPPQCAGPGDGTGRGGVEHYTPLIICPHRPSSMVRQSLCSARRELACTLSPGTIRAATASESLPAALPNAFSSSIR